MMNLGGDVVAERVDPPDGSVTFLFTDVEGSTALWEGRADEMEVALAEHDRRLRAAISQNGGYIFTTAGDSFSVAFDTADQAYAAAIAAQLGLLEPCGPIPIKVRMAIHTGVASQRDGDYFGAVVNRAARLMSAAHGGQLLLSQATVSMLTGAPSRQVELVDRGEHRLKDLLEPERIFELRHDALPSEFPALRTLDSSKNDLQAQPTELIGRERELAEVRGLLQTSRLVTLMGSGGAGKTRLALHTAAESTDDYSGGVRLVELAGLTDPAVVLDEIAEGVGVRPAPNIETVEAVVERIGGQRMLLVIDNCEHLINVVAEVVATLLKRCDALRVLATSQTVLGVRGEFLYRVPSLGVPVTDDIGDIGSSEAARLFVERARAVDSGFNLDESNARAVGTICRRLDGIPLALELAAARVAVLAPQQIADRLDMRFGLLRGGSRDTPPRHRTLRATMEWSHDLLSVEERALFRRESVFAGSFDLDAAEHVASAAPIEPVDVLELQAALVAKSFVASESVGSGARYRLPESLRSYGREQLADLGEEADTGQRHAVHYVRLSQQLRDRNRAGDRQGAVLGLEHNEDDIRAALRFLLDSGQVEAAAQIIDAIGFLWYLTGSFREGIEWCRELFDNDPALPETLLAGVLHVDALLVGSWVDPARGVEILQHEVEIRRRIGDEERLAAALNNLGNLHIDLGNSDQAEAALREAIHHSKAAGVSACLSYCSLGAMNRDSGRLDESTGYYEAGLVEAKEHGDPYGVALAQLSIAWCLVLRGEPFESWGPLRSARATMTDLGARPAVGQIDLIEGHAHLVNGDFAKAAASLKDALREPDAHWYAIMPMWAIQLGVSLTNDHASAAVLVGAIERQYAEAEARQPLWVLEQLDSLRQDLERKLGATEFAEAAAEGQQLSRSETIATGSELLSTMVAAPPGPRAQMTGFRLSV